MIPVKDFIVVEFDYQARFIKKTPLGEYNKRIKEEWRKGNYIKYLSLMGVFETEKEADVFILEFKDIDALINAILKQEEPF
jgi:hypothetical protein